MNKPELYQNSSAVSKKDAIDVLQKYSKKMKWKDFGDRIIDIGCADGGIIEIYKKYIPTKYEKIVGCDINLNMIDYAKKKYEDKRTIFRLLDIENELPADMIENFDHVFAFYLLHWVAKPKIAFSNFYKLLCEGGDCLLTCLGHVPFFSAYRVLSQKERWSPWMTDVELKISQYQDSQNPAKEFENFMKEAGFKETEVECQYRTFVFEDFQILRDFLTAVNAFKIPEEVFSEYMDDLIKVLKGHNFIEVIPGDVGKSERPKVTYTMIVGYGCK